MRIGIIGNGMLAVNCMKHMLNHQNVELVFAIYNPKEDYGSALANFCKMTEIEHHIFPKLNASETVDFITSKQPDVIFNINSYRIIKDNIINIPCDGIINFHNAPLPKYGGVHIPSWAIINGEKEHGATWHFIDEGIDTGDIIIQRRFPIDDEDTAARLMVKSINVGAELLIEFFESLLVGQCPRKTQHGESSYYSLKDLPENKGVLDFNWQFDKINRFVRGLHYLPFPNKFVHARINDDIIVNEISKVFPENTPNSTIPNTNIYKDAGGMLGARKIVKCTENDLWIMCADAIIKIESAMNPEQHELLPLEIQRILGIKEGDYLNDFTTC